PPELHVEQAARTGVPVFAPGRVAFPVSSAGRPFAVFVLLGPDGPPTGPALEGFVAALTVALGHYHEHLKADASLRASEARFQAFMTNLPHPAWVKDASGRYRVTNDAFTRTHPPARSPLVGRTDRDAFPPDLAEVLRRNDRAVLESDHPLAGEFEIPSPDGPRTYLIIKFPFQAPDGGRFLGGVSVDVTERVAAERRAAAAARLLRTIIDTAPAMISAKDRDFRYLLMNRLQANMLGTNPDDAIGKSTGELIPPEFGKTTAARDWEAMATRQSVTYEESTPDATGGLHTWLTTKTPLFSGTGTGTGADNEDVTGIVSVSVEITERVRAEAALRERTVRLEEQTRLASLRAEVGLALNQDATLPDALRDGCQAILEHTGAVFVRAWVLEPESDVLALTASVGLYTHTDGPHARIPRGQYKIGRIAADRTPHLTNDLSSDQEVSDPEWVAREEMVGFAGYPLVCEDRVVGVLALFARHAMSDDTLAALRATADILALGIRRKQAEAALRVSETQARTILQSVPMIVYMSDANGRAVLRNDRWYEFTGATPADVATSPPERWFHPEDVPAVRAAWANSVASGVPLSIEYRFRRADGTYRWHLSRAVPLRNDAGQVYQWFGTCADVDDLKTAVRTMDEARLLADAANRAKSEFLANVSHELRTPLGGVLGMVDLVLGGTLSAVQQDRVRVLRTSAQRLRGLVNDLLDVAKIEAGRVELAAAPFALGGAVTAGIAPLEHEAREKGLGVAVQFAPDLPPYAVGDADRLTQVIVNLFGNAVKFTDRGAVRVALTASDVQPDSFLLSVAVTDSGVGIPAEKLAVIFEPFVQADPGSARRFGGSGLGLSIARKLVHLMGGRLDVESEDGLGSTFRFAVRLGRTSDAVSVPVPAPVRPATRSLSILLADDHVINLRVIGELLRQAGHRVTTARDGNEAVLAVRGGGYDLILMDIHMPGMDGFEATAVIRGAETETGTRIPIIAVTARAMPEDRAECLAAGMDDVVTKPVDPPALFAALDRAIPAADPLGPAAELLARCGGDADLLAEVAAVYLSEVPELLHDVRTAVDTADWPGAGRAAHKLVSLAGTLNSTGVVKEARAIEEMVRRGTTAAAPAAAKRLAAAVTVAAPHVAQLVHKSGG
ncbi:MAG: PAS domain-containing protein, partial [Fimbriiglobus sp.]